MHWMYPTHKFLYDNGFVSVIMLLGISMGLWQEITTPTLPNLKVKLNVSYEQLGYLFSIRSFGNVLALIFAAMIYDSYPYLVYYLMTVECILAGVCTIIVPWGTYLGIVAVLLMIQSGCQNALNNGGQMLILGKFKERSIGKMHIFSIGYAIGGLLSGLIAQAFINTNPSNNHKLTKYCIRIRNLTLLQNDSHHIYNSTMHRTSEHRFEFIYLIAGLFAIVCALMFLSYKFVPNPYNNDNIVKKKESWLQKLKPKYIAEGRECFGLMMTSLLFLYYFFYICGLLVFIPYIVVYAIDPCKEYTMTQREATYIYSAVSGFFLLGRVCGSFVMDSNPAILLVTINTFNVIFNLILVSFSNKYPIALWIGACGMRFCNSIVYPSGTTFINRYIIVTSSVVSLAFLGNTFGVYSGLSLGGYLLDNYPSYYITYGCLSGMMMLWITVILMVVLGTKNGTRQFTNAVSTELKK